MAEMNPGTVQQEIADLERKLQEKRAELGAESAAPYERAEVHAEVGERIQQAGPGFQPQQTHATPAGDVPSWQDPRLADAVQQLVNVAFTESLQAAIDKAVASGNPALLDALHDVLTDELHAQLLERQKVAPAP